MKSNAKYSLTWRRGAIVGLALMLPLAMVAPAVSAADITTSPPASFKKVSSLVKLPDFVRSMSIRRRCPSGRFSATATTESWSTSPTWFR